MSSPQPTSNFHHILDGPIEDNIGFMLGKANRIKERLLDQYVSELDITGTQVKVLFYIYRYKQNRQCDIGKVLGVDNSAITRMLDRLEKKDLITRTQSLTDRREVHVQLTESGLQITRQASELASAAVNELIAPLEEQESAALRNALKKLVAFHHHN